MLIMVSNDHLKKFSPNKMKSMIFLIFNSLWNDLEKSYWTILKAGCLLYKHCFRLYRKKQKILKIKGVPKLLYVLHIVNYLRNTPSDCPQFFSEINDNLIYNSLQKLGLLIRPLNTSKMRFKNVKIYRQILTLTKYLYTYL